MALSAIRIDERTWSAAMEGRQAEWRLAIAELLEDPLAVFPPEAATLEVTISEQATTLVFFAADGRGVGGAVVVGRDALRRHVTEYVDIVRRMEKVDEGLGPGRLEALDMAKKLAHDDAAKTLARIASSIEPRLELSHATCRRLFSLLFALTIDTTALSGYRGHRPIR